MLVRLESGIVFLREDRQHREARRRLAAAHPAELSPPRTPLVERRHYLSARGDAPRRVELEQRGTGERASEAGGHRAACDGMRRHATACGGMRRHAAACDVSLAPAAVLLQISNQPPAGPPATSVNPYKVPLRDGLWRRRGATAPRRPGSLFNSYSTPQSSTRLYPLIGRRAYTLCPLV